MRDEIKSTKITIYENKATGISAVHRGSNVNGMAFNLDYIADRDYLLAQKIIKIYDEAVALPEMPNSFLETENIGQSMAGKL